MVNITLIGVPTIRSGGQPVIGGNSRTVYPPYTVQVLQNVTPDDAATLIASGKYAAVGLPILFGTGAPSMTGIEGQSYYDTAASYAAYVYHSSSWTILPGSGATEVTSVIAGIGVSVNHNTGDVTVTVGTPHHALVAGGAAGDIAVTAIKLGDRLDQVLEYVYVAGVTTDVLDLTAEFTITANGKINNTGGSDTTGNKLLVNWTKLTA